MSQGAVLDIIQEGLFTIILVGAPPLVFGLLAGLVMAIFQTVTSIQEPTLAFIPKILAVLLSLVAFGPFMIGRLVFYFNHIQENFMHFIHPRF